MEERQNWVQIKTYQYIFQEGRVENPTSWMLSDSLPFLPLIQLIALVNFCVFFRAKLANERDNEFSSESFACD